MHLITERTLREFYETPGNEISKDALETITETQYNYARERMEELLQIENKHQNILL